MLARDPKKSQVFPKNFKLPWAMAFQKVPANLISFALFWSLESLKAWRNLRVYFQKKHPVSEPFVCAAGTDLADNRWGWPGCRDRDGNGGPGATLLANQVFGFSFSRRWKTSALPVAQRRGLVRALARRECARKTELQLDFRHIAYRLTTG